jgi:hypothetical protein
MNTSKKKINDLSLESALQNLRLLLIKANQKEAKGGSCQLWMEIIMG